MREKGFNGEKIETYLGGFAICDGKLKKKLLPAKTGSG